MTCVSTAQQATEPVDTKQPLCSHIGTFGIHPISAPLQRPKTSVGPLEISYLLGLDRHASAVYVSEQDVTLAAEQRSLSHHYYTFIMLMAV